MAKVGKATYPETKEITFELDRKMNEGKYFFYLEDKKKSSKVKTESAAFTMTNPPGASTKPTPPLPPLPVCCVPFESLTCLSVPFRDTLVPIKRKRWGRERWEDKKVVVVVVVTLLPF